jgi:coatomer subunit beta
MEVKRKALGIALEMVTSRNVEDVVLFLKKQLQSTMESEFDKVRNTQQPPRWLLTDP